MRAADLFLLLEGVFSEGVVHTVGQPKVLVSITNVPTGKVKGKLGGGGKEEFEGGEGVEKRDKDKCKHL